LAAVVRAFHPARLALAAAGLVASLAVCEAALAWLGAEPWDPAGWWERPLEKVQHTGALFAGGSGTAAFRCLLLAAPLSMVWGLVGGWIARAELLRQAPPHESGLLSPPRTPPTRFVLGKARSLVLLLPAVLLVVGLFLLPGLLAGVVTLIPALGAVLVSVLLPVLMISSLAVVLVTAGSVSFAIMPAAVAAEGRDNFDALSRGYSYLFQRPLTFAWWWGVAAAVSALPLAGVCWLRAGPADPLGPEGDRLATAAAAVVSLSLLWTLQALVYLKMRRAVDGTPEDEVRDGPVAENATPPKETETAAPPATGAAGAGAGAAERPRAGEAAPQPVLPRKEISFQDTIRGTGAGYASQLVVVLAGLLWVALVLAVGGRAAWHLAAPPNQDFTAAAVRQAVLDLAGQRPVLLAGIATLAVLAGAVGLARPAKMAARMTAVRLVYQGRLPLRVAWSSAGKTRWQGFGSVLLFSAGTGLFLVALFLLPLAFEGTAGWHEVALSGGPSLLLLGAGALGLGRVAVELTRPGEAPAGLVETVAGNGGETLASAAVNLLTGPARSVAVTLLAGLTWLVLCESAGWWGGEHARWLRWGLDGALMPWPDEGGFEGVACLIAGLWFFALGGLVLAYPISYVLGWGTACYLRARQQGQGVPPGELPLTEEERQALQDQPSARAQLLARLRPRGARPSENGDPPAS
jgi:hypothetical protein